MASADALEDDFQDESLLAAEPTEADLSAVALDAEPAAEVEDEDDGSAAKKIDSKKRKAVKEPANKAKRQKKAGAAASSADETEPIALAPPEMQLDYFTRKLKLAFPKATSLELDEMQLAQKNLMDVSGVPASSRSDLSTFLKAALPRISEQLSKPSKKKGSPRVIVIASAALRVADLCRQAKELAGKGEVAKLFSKHCKLSEHEKYCRDSTFSIAVATPSRLEKLLHSEPPSLGLDSVSHLVLDVSFLDAKKRSLLENEGRDVVFRQVLADDRIRAKLAEDRLKVVFF